MPDLSFEGFGVPAFLVGGVILIGLATLLLHLLFPAVKRSGSRRTRPPSLPNHCPMCQQELREVENHGVQIEVCPRCHGVWLSKGKLEKILS